MRRAAALALLSIGTMAPGLRPQGTLLSELAERELRRPSPSIGDRTAFELASPFRLDARGNEISPCLELVFLLLAIGGNISELRLALSAITDDDAGRRGTGLEYLDNLLPLHLRARVVALAEDPELTQADLRVPQHVISELARGLRSGDLDIRELRRRFGLARKEQYDAKA